MKHIMVDLETLGTTPQAPIISIGAVFFDPETGETGNSFHEKIEFGSACAGRTIDPCTIAWWFKQDDEARHSVLESGRSQDAAIRMFAEFVLDGEPDAIWGNGATFDISILEDIYRQHKLRCPWPFWSVRDVRTIVDCAQGIVDRKSFEFEGTQHDALADALHQAKYVSAMWQALRATNPPKDGGCDAR